jgi:hypothetical protein
VPYAYFANGALMLVLNIGGLIAANFFETLVFLDTVGTAMAGLAYGPWAGMTVGLLTNLAISGPGTSYRPYFWFTHVNVLCGLLWGWFGWYRPPAFGPETQTVLYILLVGLLSALVSTVSSVPVRIRLGFNSNHMIDGICKEFQQNNTRYVAQFKIFLSEFLLSHFLDKTISTTVGVMFVLEIVGGGISHPTNSSEIRTTYHDLIEFLAALYYIALGVGVKTLGAKMARNDIFTLLGPLGFFSVLIALPILMVLVGVH